MNDEADKRTVIKKYANRRLYNTGTSTYVTLDDLAEMVKGGEEFQVVDAKTGEDLTRPVLTQIIFEQESKGPNLLPINFLRQMIRFYGDSMQTLVPSYLDFSINTLARDQEKLRGEVARAFGTQAIEAIEEQVQRNMQMFERAFRMFSPFPVGSEEETKPASVEPKAEPAASAEIEALKRQLADMHAMLEKLIADRR